MTIDTDQARQYAQQLRDSVHLKEHAGADLIEALADEQDRLVTTANQLADLWDRQLKLGTTQGGGRRYQEHCRQHDEANRLLIEMGVRP